MVSIVDTIDVLHETWQYFFCNMRSIVYTMYLLASTDITLFILELSSFLTVSIGQKRKGVKLQIVGTHYTLGTDIEKQL